MVTPLRNRMDPQASAPRFSWAGHRSQYGVADSDASPVQVSARQLRALQWSQGIIPALPHGGFTHHPSWAASARLRDLPAGITQLRDLYGTVYTGSLGVGTVKGAAEVELSVIFDTGSSDLWVSSDLCPSRACGPEPKPKFNRSRSETFRRPPTPRHFETSYGSGVIRGELGIDDVRVGPLVSPGQEVGLIAEEKGQVSFIPIDGIVGLGFPDLAAAGDPDMSFMGNLVAREALPSPRFAFYLHRHHQLGGGVLWGGEDSRLYRGSLRWFPIVEKSYWALDLVGFQIGNETFNFTTAHNLESGPEDLPPWLVVDTGTTFFTAEGAIYRRIRALAPHTACDQVHMLPSLTYFLRDHAGAVQRLTIAPEEYTVQGSPGRCLPAFVSIGDIAKRPIMIIGEVFMRHFFTVFHWGTGKRGHGARVGFAPARYDGQSKEFFSEQAAKAENSAIL